MSNSLVVICLQIVVIFVLCSAACGAQYNPTAPIKIDKDDAGILHVTAKNELDLLYGQGYATAQERLWEVDFNRRVAKGALAAIIGPDGLESDKIYATFGLWNASLAAEQVLDRESRAQLNAYISGLNKYVAYALSNTSTLPIEFGVFEYTPESFTIADVILIIKFMSFGLSGNYVPEMSRLYAQFGLGLSKSQINSVYAPYEDSFPTTINADDVNKLKPFSYQFEPLPPPRFADPVGNVKREESEDASAQDFKSATPKMTIPDLINPKGPFAWTKKPAFILPASNSWTISGSRTASGKPILANDPHLAVQLPAIWILFSLKSPTLNATGATIVGLPGISTGRNDKISWGLTNVGADVQDLFKLQVDSRGKTYTHKNIKYNFVNRTEVIKVRGDVDVVLTVRETLYGPVISDIVETYGQTLALQWTSLTHVNDTSCLAFLNVNKAQNFRELRSVLKKFYIAPSQNFMYADIDGNIAYQIPGKIPVRRGSANGEYVADGTGRDDWIGYIQFEELPSASNPDRGYLVNSNNKVAPKSYPYLILNDRDWIEKYRALRVEELIKATPRHTVLTVSKIQTDQTTAAWREIKSILQDTNSSRLTPTARNWRNALLGWNGDVNKDSNKATVYEFWLYEIGRIANFSGYAHVYNPALIVYVFNYANHRLDAYATDAFQRTIDGLLQMYNGTVPLWGDVQTLYFQHPLLSLTPLSPLSDRVFRRGGDSVTVNVAAPNQTPDDLPNPFVFENFGPSYRHIIDTQGRNMDSNSVWVLPGGESGDPYSPYYDNLLPLWDQGKYVPQKLQNYTAVSTQTIRP